MQINQVKPIGGYFGWEFPQQVYSFPNDHGALVNSGHGALQLILKNLGEIDKVWIPYFTCSIVEKAIQNIGIRVVKYSVNYELEIAEDIKLGTHDYLIYTNYFGIMDSYVHLLASQYGFKLIIDNAQAFYVDSIEECHQLYSPRKFVGVGDGGIAVSSHLLSTEHLPLAKSEFHSTHLLMRAEGDIATGYTFFKESEEILGDSSLQLMSLITRRNLHSLDYEKIKQIRMSNFRYLHQNLNSSNGLQQLLDFYNLESVACPMVYPYYTEDITLRGRLIEQNVFVAQYWPNVLKECEKDTVEYSLCKYIIPLPIDQRYNEEDMNRIVKLIKG